MCGIVYAKSLNGKDMTTTVLNRFESQRERGTTSFGYYLPAKDKLVHNIKEQRIKTLLRRTKGENQEIMFHHRKSTSTEDVRNACHPFSTKDAYDHEYIGIHNGVVRNPQELKTMHEKEGIKYVSVQPSTSTGWVRFNDSEALVYDLAAYFEGKVKKLTAYGTIAFVVMRLGADGKPDKLYFGHNSGNPLVMKRNKKTLQVTSTGDGKPVPTDILHVYDYATNQIHTEAMEIPSASTFRYHQTAIEDEKDHKYDFDNHAQLKYRTTDWYRFNMWDTKTQQYLPNENGRKGYEWDKTLGQYVNSSVRNDAKNAQSNKAVAPYIPTDEEVQEALELLEMEEDREAADTPRDYQHGFVDGEFTLRGTSKKEIKESLLVTGRGLDGALADCRKEILGAISEIDRIDQLDLGKVKNLQAEFDYWDMLQSYREILQQIAGELRTELQKRTDKEDAGARTLGFQIPTPKEQQKLA